MYNCIRISEGKKSILPKFCVEMNTNLVITTDNFLEMNLPCGEILLFHFFTKVISLFFLFPFPLQRLFGFTLACIFKGVVVHPPSEFD